jgi:hypothetical protein
MGEKWRLSKKTLFFDQMLLSIESAIYVFRDRCRKEKACPGKEYV